MPTRGDAAILAILASVPWKRDPEGGYVYRWEMDMPDGSKIPVVDTWDGETNVIRSVQMPAYANRIMVNVSFSPCGRHKYGSDGRCRLCRRHRAPASAS